jgi:hypothetical protein
MYNYSVHSLWVLHCSFCCFQATLSDQTDAGSISARSLVLLTCLLILLILSYVTVTVPVAKMLWQRRWGGNTIVSKPGAAFQLGIWALTYIAFLHFNKTEPETPPPI